MIIVGMSAFGTSDFKSYSPPIRNIKLVELENATYDEIHIREKTDNMDTSNVKEDWQLDTFLLAKFMNDLEAGNIQNNGLEIAKFAIKRRSVNEVKPMTIGYKDFINNNTFVYNDFTQGVGDYIYSIVPVGVNNLEGLSNDVLVNSTFAGFFLVDKETGSSLPFDKSFSSNTFSTVLNQGITQIDKLTKYPSFYYTEQEYHSFSVSSVFIPEEWQTSGQLYESILNTYIRSHKPFLAKSGSGEIYIVNVSTPNKSAAQNTYHGQNDYLELTLNFVEIMDADTYNDLFL